MPTDLQTSIQSALQALSPVEGQAADFRSGHLDLLKTLGYESTKTIPIAGAKPAAFLEMLESNAPDANFDNDKALYGDWEKADLLFQFTDEELDAQVQKNLFDESGVQPGLLQSYLFFAIELNGQSAVNGTYARGKLTAIARQINRAFPMPVMVLIQHPEQGRDVLSIAVINRRANKREQHKDVLGKVTIIRDISLADPHRGHLDILESFAVPNLRHPQKLPINSFETLHTAWEEIFNIELLNKRFYKELANWYFWALPQVDFPTDLEPDDEKRRATGLIRLLTRLIFCWFIKEKGLIPEKLFHRADLADILKDFDPDSRDSSQYYQAILQNLFFATLNQRMGKDSKGEPFRHFVPDEGFQKNRKTHDLNNYYRYEALFAGSQDEALQHFADIPFLNGGLFECLDRRIEEDKKTYYLDGFSRNAKKRPSVPNYLFFADEIKGIDLSDVYHDNRRKTESVSGLIRILNRYKFTIVENTPIDQEIALDPELLGKVFENLLASYNEETKTTARKQTGSFYTPRPIVDYMVDESLKAYLKKSVEQTFLSASSSANTQTEMSVSPSEITKTRRHLPHWKTEGAIYWTTFRMADSLPQGKLKAWRAERDLWASHHPEPWSNADWEEYNERFGDKLEEWLDAGMGSRALAKPEVREAVKNCLLKFNGERLHIHSAVIMPNHVHALIEPVQGHDLSKILQGIKGASAREANTLLGSTGSSFWLDESYDHIVRSEAQYQHFLRYIAENPIKAKLREHEYWLKEGSTDIPVCHSPQKSTDRNVCATLSDRIDQLFLYSQTIPEFTDREKDVLIRAIDRCKILDPACGSGAFPMGILHKLVFILGKLDPGNERWKQTQLDKLDSAPMREELERNFEDNDDDYGRKLYLIENCLYGVDIQPIAIQISKLRFFISLICDQKTNRDKAKNHGIRPLPNLETKFVAADTLIGLPEMDQSLLIDPRVDQIEKEIASLYHRHFGIQRRDQKLALQRKIKDLRKELGSILAESLMAPAKAQHVANWDPFDPQASSDFFDPFWMFGIFAGQKTRKDAGTLTGNLSGIIDDELTATTTESDGFDIVIGNPPYGVKFSKTLKKRHASSYPVGACIADSYVYFILRAFQLLNTSGSLNYVVPNTFCDLEKGESFRGHLLNNYLLKEIWQSGWAFTSAVVDTVIIHLQKSHPSENTDVRVHTTKDDYKRRQFQFLEIPLKKIDFRTPLRNQKIRELIRSKSNPLSDTFTVKAGVKMYEVGKGTPPQTRAIANKKPFTIIGEAPKGWRNLYRGGDIDRFVIKDRGERVNYGPWLAAPRAESLFESPKILMRRTDDRLRSSIDKYSAIAVNSCHVIKSQSSMDEKSYLAYVAILNSAICQWMFEQDNPQMVGKTFSEIKVVYVERLSIPKISTTSTHLLSALSQLAASLKNNTNPTPYQFLEALIDACVMECYFREHMAERDLLFQDAVAAQLKSVGQTFLSASSSEKDRQECLSHLYETLQATDLPQKLQAIPEKSPDLLGVILKEGKV